MTDYSRMLSIRSQRSRAYLDAAMALTSVIPALCVCLVLLSLFTDLLPDSTLMRTGVGLAGLFSGVAGYMMLRIYPRNLEILRETLSRLAAGGDIPDHADLQPGEQDFSDIERYLNEVIGGLRRHIAQLDAALKRSEELLRTVEAQSREIMEAERQRVMLESLGTACHHIGQPMTVLSLYLSRMHDMSRDAVEHRELGTCLDAVETISGILKKLMQVSEYRTVPYVNLPHVGAEGETRLNIIDIEPAGTMVR